MFLLSEFSKQIVTLKGIIFSPKLQELELDCGMLHSSLETGSLHNFDIKSKHKSGINEAIKHLPEDSLDEWCKI